VFYVPSKAEPADDGELKEHILDPIPRPLAAQRPNVTDLPGIRSHFCFRVKDAHTIYMRVHSCHCEVCLSEDWLECKNEDAGPWEEMPLHETAAAAPATTRALTQLNSQRRRALARQAPRGHLLALESKDDAHGFPWWLAVVTTPMFHVDKRQKKNQDGEWLGEGHHLGIRYYEREPPDSEHNFKRCADGAEIIICAEGVIYAANDLKMRPLGKRSARRRTPLDYSRETCLLTFDDAGVVVNIEDSWKALPLYF
jgi:hypothetical protein